LTRRRSAPPLRRGRAEQYPRVGNRPLVIYRALGKRTQYVLQSVPAPRSDAVSPAGSAKSSGADLDRRFGRGRAVMRRRCSTGVLRKSRQCGSRAGMQFVEPGSGRCSATRRVGYLGCGRPCSGHSGDGERDSAATVQVEDAAAVMASSAGIGWGVRLARPCGNDRPGHRGTRGRPGPGQAGRSAPHLGSSPAWCMSRAAQRPTQRAAGQRAQTALGQTRHRWHLADGGSSDTYAAPRRRPAALAAAPATTRWRRGSRTSVALEQARIGLVRCADLASPQRRPHGTETAICATAKPWASRFG